jgi:hypothetical protein
MELLKLKVEIRPSLYYKKYKYRALIKIPNARGFPTRYHRSLSNDKVMLTTIRTFIGENIEGNSRRYTYSGISFYSNDLGAVNEFYALSSTHSKEIFEAEIGPQGIKTFKKDPPAKYRAYLKDKKIESTVRDELCEFFVNNPKLKPNRPLHRFVRPENTYSFSHTWIYSGQYFDYDDPAILTYMTLLFPGIIGKTYKLEKQQS